MIHQPTLPSHAICYGLYLNQRFDTVSEYNCAFWPQDSIHLQQNIGYITPERSETVSAAVLLILSAIWKPFLSFS
jgi:hypothetical protein